MAKGRSHLTLELGTLPLWIAAGILLGVTHHPLMVFTLSYLVSSFLLSPDLDLPQSDAAHRWGPLRILWLPYARAFRHRGLSHSIVWGPLTRVGYLLVLAALIWGISWAIWGVAWRPPHFGRQLTAAAAGLYAAHLLHVAFDNACVRRPRLSKVQRALPSSGLRIVYNRRRRN